MGRLDETLNILLEQSSAANGAAREAMRLARDLERAQQSVLDLQHRLHTTKRKLSSELAVAIRRSVPGLDVDVNDDGCMVAYRAKHLRVCPDIEKGVWYVTSDDPRFLREFTRVHGSRTAFTENVQDVLDAIVSHFTQHYKTLGESIQGTGRLSVNGRQVALCELVERCRPAPLPSRRYR